MRCASHSDFEAVAVCPGCQRGLCEACAAAFQPPACADCVLAHNKGVIRRFARNLGLMVVLAAVAVLLFKNLLAPMQLAVLGAASAFAPWGWEFIQRMGFTSGAEFIQPWARMTSMLFHLAASMLLGLLVGPYQIWKAAKEIRNAWRTNREIEARDAEAAC